MGFFSKLFGRSAPAPMTQGPVSPAMIQEIYGREDGNPIRFFNENWLNREGMNDRRYELSLDVFGHYEISAAASAPDRSFHDATIGTTPCKTKQTSC